MRWFALPVLALVALPVSGGTLDQELTAAEKHALTPIDTWPTRESLDIVLQATDVAQRIARLKEIALPATVNEDFGVRLRAIRALPQYCTALCRSDGVASGDPAHLALRAIYATLNPGDHTGTALLRVRATLEALGATRSGLTTDVNLLLSWLNHGSRDIRAAVARALEQLCNRAAVIPLQTRANNEGSEQVKRAIRKAVGIIEQCAP